MFIEMLSDIAEHLKIATSQLGPWTVFLSSVGLMVACLSTFQYAVDSVQFGLEANAPGQNQIPPLVPSAIPFIGKVPLEMLWDPLHFIIKSRKIFWNSHPVRVKVFGRVCYIVQGAANMKSLFKTSSLSAFDFHGLFLQKVVGLPKEAALRYEEDDSGERPDSNPGSTVAPKNRVQYLTYSFFKRFLAGSNLLLLMKRLESHLTKHLISLPVSNDDEWTYLDNFLSIFETNVTSAMIDTMCGPYIMRENPEFADDLWSFDRGVGRLMLQLPWPFVQKTRSSRNRAVEAIKCWRNWAEENFDPAEVGPGGENPYWGTTMFRDLVDIYTQMDGFDEDSVAKEILAFIWATNTNSVISAFWASLDVFRDPDILSRVRDEVDSCLIEQTSPTSEPSFDMDRLCKQPMLQAVFAETLRLRLHGFVMRYSSRDDVIINDDWRIPKNSMILTASTPGHMDPEVWSTGSCELFPVEKFCPGRFLDYSEEEQSLIFSTKRAKGHWTPFGGGRHPCPGRHFSKLEIMFTVALLITMYDCEVLSSEKNMQMSAQNYGFGVLGPSGPVPVRIRRRAQST